MVIVVTYFLSQKNQEKKTKKIIEKENKKKQENTHEESLEDCPSWSKWQAEKFKDQHVQDWQISDSILIDKRPYWW